MRNILLIILFIAFQFNAQASIVYASDFGWNADDATSAFQDAVKSEADTVIVSKQAGDWIVGPNLFFDLHNKTIIFQQGVVLKAKADAFPDDNDCLMKFLWCDNIKIIGYGATIKMNKAEYAKLTGEWRHCIAINNSTNISVYGLKLIESGGDGIYISGNDGYGDQPYSENIILKDVWCDNQYRQGISICSARHVLVQNSWFTNTRGTLPMSGVDIEPYLDYQRVEDVVFEKCRFTGNYGNGIQLALENLTSASTPVDITFRDCYTSGNHDISNPYASTEIFVAAPVAQDPVKGNVKFERCLVENSNWRAVYVRKSIESFFAGFNDCVFSNVSKISSDPDNTPIWIEVSDFGNVCPRFGGVDFNNCLISYSNKLYLMGSRGNISTCPGMGNVRLNNLTVINKDTSVTINVTKGGGAPDTTCIFDYHKFKRTPVTNVSFSAGNSIIECTGQNSILESARIADTTNFPVAFTYKVEGTALQGEDYSRMNGFIIIPAGLLSNRDSVFVLKDEVAEGSKNMLVTVNASALFTSASLPQSVTVLDCLTGLDKKKLDNPFTVFPNPASDFIEIKFSEDFVGYIQLINQMGQAVSTQKAQGRNIRIRIHELVKGTYFVVVQTEEKCRRERIYRFVKM